MEELQGHRDALNEYLRSPPARLGPEPAGETGPTDGEGWPPEGNGPGPEWWFEHEGWSSSDDDDGAEYDDEEEGGDDNEYDWQPPGIELLGAASDSDGVATSSDEEEDGENDEEEDDDKNPCPVCGGFGHTEGDHGKLQSQFGVEVEQVFLSSYVHTGRSTKNGS